MIPLEPLRSRVATHLDDPQVAEGHSTLGFSQLAPLFPSAAPLESWSALLAGDPEGGLPELTRDLEARADGPHAAFALRLVRELDQVLAPEEKGLLAAFVVATLARGWELPAPALGELSVEELLDLADLWLPGAPFHRELARQLAIAPRGAALVRLGEVAAAELRRRWNGLDISQRLYGLDVLAALGGEAVADFFVARFDEARATWAKQLEEARERRERERRDDETLELPLV